VRRAGVTIHRLLIVAFVLVWLCLWTVGALSADIECVRRLVRESAAAHYLQAPGTVVRLDRLPRTSGKGHLYFDVQVAYAYELAGQQYEGHSFRPTDQYASDDWANAHPVGRPVTVLYDPADPANAALDPGDASRQWTNVAALLPFNFVMLAGWRLAFMVFTVWLCAPARDPAADPDAG
jgi:hypothetical protein